MITTNSLGKRIAKTDKQIAAFWRWFGDSSVVDGRGRPLVVYHGTDVDFDRFDPSRGIGGGNWFTPDRRDMDQYAWGSRGQRAMPCYLKITELINLPTEQYEPGEAARIGWRKRKHTGHGVARIGPDGDVLAYIIYDARQVKSAIGNRGTFDPEDPVITNPRHVFGGMDGLTPFTVPKRIVGLRSGWDIKLACRVGGITFYIVNGPKIRKQWADFLSGHHLAYPFIPKHEIWIDDTIANREWPGFVAAHELIELLLMNYKKKSYEKAHDAANQMEQEMRQHHIGHGDTIMVEHFMENLGAVPEVEQLARTAFAQFFKYFHRTRA